MASEGLHEPLDQLSEATVDRHRAVASLLEELDAIDWYDQRVDATSDATLAAILMHNRDEDKEHAAMALEWLRRRDAAFDRHLRTYLFTDGPVTEEADAPVAEEADAPTAVDAEATEAAPPTAADGGRGLGIGSLKGASS